MATIVLVIMLAVLVLLAIIIPARLSDRQNSKILVEPLGLLIRKFRLARIIGNQAATETAIGVFRQTQLSSQSLLEGIFRELEFTVKRKVPEVNLLAREESDLFVESRKVNIIGREVTFTIGPALQLLRQSERYNSDSQDLTNEKRKELSEIIKTAGENGFLALGIATRTKKGGKLFPLTLIGIILLEPQFDADIQRRLRVIAKKQNLVFISIMDRNFVSTLMTLLTNEKPLQVITKDDFDKESPDKIESILGDARGIAEVGIKEKYLAIRLMQHYFTLELLSKNPDDSRLPVKHFFLE